ncbi:VapE domain-containing protein [Streptococcus gallolyticus]|uniref:VapE domain-containing protein n=1 Tax=Streptococcus gallolyticus TaxID=315405 RepID=UPI000887D88D|nr:VapE domain-containing protein [Streptococcus gallolyticus]SDK14418.1 Predicted P-loop ATPase and inactivated derivatives [Streptococcus gallolyticus]SDL63611.1 Predicted P-loop ATPase and inactivated derivatives [Streptococcus gallolyticus]
MSEFIEQLNEIVPDNKNNVTSINSRRLKRDENGKIIKNRNNLLLLFRGEDIKLNKLFKYNEATKNVEVTRNQQLSDYITIKHGLLSDDTVRQLWAYLSECWGLEYKENDIANVVKIIALNKSYNPIKIFLEKAKATAEPVDPFKLIQKYINIEDNQYNRIVFDLMFRGAIARVYHAGIQFDYCLDLVGKQGTGKTTFLREIFKGFYGEISSYTEKDDLLKMLELWAVNDDELVATSKVSFNELKQIITMREIRIRRPYGKATEIIPVDFIFTRTTNDTGHLKDRTGDRRFLAVEVLPKTDNQVNQISPQDLLNIWGNYYKAYEGNSKLYYDDTSEEGKLIAREREKYKYQDDIIEKLEWYLSTKIPEDFFDVTTKKHYRKQYYTDLEETGTAYKTNDDRQAGAEWVGTVERDRLSINDVIYEIFGDESEPASKIKNKIKVYMNNLEDWEYQKTVYFGKRRTSGFLKKH